MGTAGGLRQMNRPTGPILVINGDILTGVHFQEMLIYHRKHLAELTVGVRKYDMQVPFGVVECKGERITKLREKPSLSFFINAGTYSAGTLCLGLHPGRAAVRYDRSHPGVTRRRTAGSELSDYGILARRRASRGLSEGTGRCTERKQSQHADIDNRRRGLHWVQAYSTPACRRTPGSRIGPSRTWRRIAPRRLVLTRDLNSLVGIFVIARYVRTAVSGRDAVVHLAAVVGDPACSREPAVARAINLDASLSLD